MTIIRFVSGAAALATLFGCESTTTVESNYGQSVRQMITAQTYDPKTLTDPSTKPVEGADPDMVNAAINVFRETVSPPDDVGKDIVIQVGNQGR